MGPPGSDPRRRTSWPTWSSRSSRPTWCRYWRWRGSGSRRPRRCGGANMSAVVLLGMLLAADAAPAAGKYFKITVVDEETGRGVPLVELRTVNQLRYYTDSNGVVAFHEPGLMGQPVFFSVGSHGYEFAKDGFGFRGK